MRDRQAAAEDSAQPDDARPAPPTGLLWTRPAKEKRIGLTREAIVDAAMALADADGLDAVSIRRVAAALNVRPMSLYSHIHRKEDLFDLMGDQIAAEVLITDPLPGDWREALRAIAHSTRATCLRHPWMLGTLGTRPRLGPNAIRHVEQSLAAVAGLTIDLRRKFAILRAVDTYTIGHVIAELGQRELRRREGVSDSEWLQSLGSYLERLVGSGDYPLLAGIEPDDLLLAGGDHVQQTFDDGLEWLLTGIATSLGATRP